MAHKKGKCGGTSAGRDENGYKFQVKG